MRRRSTSQVSTTGFFIFAIFLTALSVIPLGSGIVTIPFGIGLMLFGNIAGGLFVVLFHVIVITNVDNFLRPILVPQEARLDPALMLLSVFSGITMFGFFGIILGPVLMILIVTTISVYLAVYKGVESQHSTMPSSERKKLFGRRKAKAASTANSTKADAAQTATSDAPPEPDASKSSDEPGSQVSRSEELHDPLTGLVGLLASASRTSSVSTECAIRPNPPALPGRSRARWLRSCRRAGPLSVLNLSAGAIGSPVKRRPRAHTPPSAARFSMTFISFSENPGRACAVNSTTAGPTAGSSHRRQHAVVDGGGQCEATGEALPDHSDTFARRLGIEVTGQGAQIIGHRAFLVQRQAENSWATQPRTRFGTSAGLRAAMPGCRTATGSPP